MNLTIKDHPMQDVMVVAMATLSNVSQKTTHVHDELFSSREQDSKLSLRADITK